MDQRNKSSWLSTAGLFLVGFFVVGLAVVTSKPFEERFGYAETAMVSEVLPDSTSDTSGDDPVKVAQDESGEAAGDTASESKDAAPNDAADESASKPEDEPPTEAAAAGGEDKCCKKGDETPPFELIAKVPPVMPVASRPPTSRPLMPSRMRMLLPPARLTSTRLPVVGL